MTHTPNPEPKTPVTRSNRHHLTYERLETRTESGHRHSKLIIRSGELLTLAEAESRARDREHYHEHQEAPRLAALAELRAQGVLKVVGYFEEPTVCLRYQHYRTPDYAGTPAWEPGDRPQYCQVSVVLPERPRPLELAYKLWQRLLKRMQSVHRAMPGGWDDSPEVAIAALTALKAVAVHSLKSAQSGPFDQVVLDRDARRPAVEVYRAL